MSLLRGCCVLVVLLLVPSWAAAETVGVLEFEGKDVPEAALERFELAAVDGLEGANFEVKNRAALTESLKRGAFVDGCSFGPCLRQVRKDGRVDLVLVVRVQVLGSTYSFIASLVDTKTGLLATQVSRSCSACSIDDAALTASMLGSDLLLARSSVDDEASSAKSRASAGDAVPEVAETRRSRLRTTSYLFLGASLAAGAVGGYLLYDDQRDRGVPMAVGAGAGFLSGVTMFLFSREF